MITEIAFFVYPVSRMARARKFYEDTLGLKLESNWQNKWVEYDIAGATFAITTMEKEHKAGLRGGIISFEVDDLDAEVERLRKRGVRFVREVGTTPVCRMAMIADPDGNEIIIHKRNV
jgi:predicted enzyme related to lactoylglutathione lyase